MVYIFLNCPSWMADGTLGFWQRAMVYQFIHANPFHLAVNALALWGLLAPENRNNAIHLGTGLLIGFLVYGCSPRPLLGISNAIFAIAGLRTPPFSSQYWRSKNVWLFLGINALLVFLPRVSAITHLLSFAIGLMLVNAQRLGKGILRSINRTRNDIKRITH